LTGPLPVAIHAHARRPEDTDWPQIATLYATLGRMTPSAVVRLNWAVAVAMADGPAIGIQLVDELMASGALDRYHLMHSARADLLRRLGRMDEAAASYRRALELATNPVDRRFLARRIADVTGAPSQTP
jgi:RNA polymerase sigma-70 factor (ECF subfamily)